MREDYVTDVCSAKHRREMGLADPTCPRCHGIFCNDNSLRRHMKKPCEKSRSSKNARSPRGGMNHSRRESRASSIEQQPLGSPAGLSQQQALPEVFDAPRVLAGISDSAVCAAVTAGLANLDAEQTFPEDDPRLVYS